MSLLLPTVLFEDNHLIIVNKKPSQLVQGDKTGDVPLIDSLKEYLKKKYNKETVFLGLVHRLDRPTSGILIFAKTSKSLTRLNEMFSKREIEKIYWAVVPNLPNNKEEDTMVHYLKKNEKNNKSTVFSQETEHAKKAILHYKSIFKLDNYYLLQIILETGRHHQIRAQLGFAKAPIKGDLKYGAKRNNENGCIHLHARQISFIHPVKLEKITITAPLPENDKIWETIETNFQVNN